MPATVSDDALIAHRLRQIGDPGELDRKNMQCYKRTKSRLDLEHPGMADQAPE
jgi:hypothetical protein